MKRYTKKEIEKCIQDIENPLTSILSSVDLLINKITNISQEEEEEVLTLVREEAKRVLAILENLKNHDGDIHLKNSDIIDLLDEPMYNPFAHGRAKILIIDDDGSIRRLLKMDLEKLGYEVYTAYSGKEGFEFIKEIDPDLIISDITIPEMNGIELYKKLITENIIIPFIFITTDGSIQQKIDSLRLGVDGYLTKPFSKEELIALMESLLVKAKRISQNIFIDALTKVYNRKFIEEKLSIKIEKAIELSKSFSLAMCDIDYFKKINDTYGHGAGDKVLTFLGHFFRSHLRDNDIVSRYGGEEFLIFLDGVGGDKAYTIMNRLKEQLSKEEINIGEGKKIRITISVGISSFPGKYHSFKEMVKAADDALYKAKTTGRNKVIIIQNLEKEDING